MTSLSMHFGACTGQFGAGPGCFGYAVFACCLGIYVQSSEKKHPIIAQILLDRRAYGLVYIGLMKVLLVSADI